jgi:hypothetical protein
MHRHKADVYELALGTNLSESTGGQAFRDQKIRHDAMPSPETISFPIRGQLYPARVSAQATLMCASSASSLR